MANETASQSEPHRRDDGNIAFHKIARATQPRPEYARGPEEVGETICEGERLLQSVSSSLEEKLAVPVESGSRGGAGAEIDYVQKSGVDGSRIRCWEHITVQQVIYGGVITIRGAHR